MANVTVPPTPPTYAEAYDQPAFPVVRDCACGRAQCAEWHVYRVGQVFYRSDLGHCTVTRVRVYGTYDLETATGRTFRVSGLTRYRGTP